MTEVDEHEATPDELLLELMDLVVLAFPAPLHEMSISFIPSDDGSRPALTDLDGRAHPDAPKRPHLGHDDNAVLDAINALLVEFAEATHRQGGVRVMHGRIVITDGADGDRVVELREMIGDTDEAREELAMSRRFDRSELRWLFWTAALFRALEATQPAEARARASTDEALRRQARFDIDMSEGRIVFSGGAAGSPPTPWKFELLGSWSDETKRFLWGWGNDEVSPSLKARVETVRATSSGEGLRALTEASFGCPEPCAERLARHAAARMNAFGMYRAPFASAQGKGFMYLALFSL